MTAAEAARAREATEVLNARSYAELLQPIPNAVALLMAADAVNVARAKAEAAQNPNVKLAQYEYGYGYYHHRGGSACLNSFSDLISGAPAGVKPPRHAAAR
jgi:hypothetical protein